MSADEKAKVFCTVESEAEEKPVDTKEPEQPLVGQIMLDKVPAEMRLTQTAGYGSLLW